MLVALPEHGWVRSEDETEWVNTKQPEPEPEPEKEEEEEKEPEDPNRCKNHCT